MIALAIPRWIDPVESREDPEYIRGFNDCRRQVMHAEFVRQDAERAKIATDYVAHVGGIDLAPVTPAFGAQP